MNPFVRILIAVNWQVKNKALGDDVQEEGVAQKSEKIRRFKSNFWISLNDSFHHPILFIWGNALKCSSPILKHHPAENFLRLNIIYSRKYGRHSFLSASQYVPNKNWQDWNNSSNNHKSSWKVTLSMEICKLAARRCPGPPSLLSVSFLAPDYQCWVIRIIIFISSSPHFHILTTNCWVFRSIIFIPPYHFHILYILYILFISSISSK